MKIIESYRAFSDVLSWGQSTLSFQFQFFILLAYGLWCGLAWAWTDLSITCIHTKRGILYLFILFQILVVILFFHQGRNEYRQPFKKDQQFSTLSMIYKACGMVHTDVPFQHFLQRWFYLCSCAQNLDRKWAMGTISMLNFQFYWLDGPTILGQNFSIRSYKTRAASRPP